MTHRKKSPSSLAAMPPGRVVLVLCCIASLFLILRNAEVAISSAKEALSLCSRTVIPSLFPFMVLSELIIRSGTAGLLSKILSPICRLLFGIGGEGASAILLGVLGGFPVGARTAVALYEDGRIDEGEMSHLLCFCNLPSSAFVISAVGISLFGSRALGNLLYAITLFSALVTGVVMRLFSKDKTQSAKHPLSHKKVERTRRLGVTAFCDAISDSARTMLSVCAFVVFFATLVGCLECACVKANLPHTLSSLIFGFFELTGGVAHASSVEGVGGMLLCAAALGWSGLSVHFQIMNICGGCPISFRPYFVAKVAQSILNVLALQVVLLLFSPSFERTDSISSASTTPSPSVVALCLAMFAISLVFLCVRKIKKIRAAKDSDKA